MKAARRIVRLPSGMHHRGTRFGGDGAVKTKTGGEKCFIE